MTPYLLEFARRHSYAFADEITLPLTLLSAAPAEAELLAKLDTGSTFCVFERKYAELLSLDVEAGAAQRIRTATGHFYAYGHEVGLSFFGFEWQPTVYFAESESFDLNVLGRVGFLDHLRIALVEYEQTFYASLYDQE
jgi:hypothetical protein